MARLVLMLEEMIGQLEKDPGYPAERKLADGLRIEVEARGGLYSVLMFRIDGLPVEQADIDAVMLNWPWSCDFGGVVDTKRHGRPAVFFGVGHRQ